mmetsp:Transcript_8474/g.7515  ORF Transcript_8474/g.7515 Transcript_8474/m.7515 type:complete len:542 (+) Transcript_8474:177-1802(+)
MSKVKAIHPALQNVPEKSKLVEAVAKLGNTPNHQDGNFKHETASITANTSDPKIDEIKKCVWKRPHEIFGTDYDNIKLFGTMNPNNIIPGALDMVYFPAAVYAVAERPARLMSCFVNKSCNSLGIYSIRLHRAGMSQEVLVDDYIPCVERDGKFVPLFSQNTENELWMFLLEKAVAKLYKTYLGLKLFTPEQVLEDILGVPSYTHNIKKENENQIWRNVLGAEIDNYIISATSKNDSSASDKGLLKNTLYNLISVHEIKGHKLIKVRNVGDKVKWTGLFQEEGDLWDDELREEIGHYSSEDGSFMITLEELIKCFESYTIARIEDGYTYTVGIKDAKQMYKNSAYFDFRCHSKQKVYIKVANLPFFNDQKTKIEPYPLSIPTLTLLEAGGSTFTPINHDPNDVLLPSENIKTMDLTNKKGITIEGGNYVIRVKNYNFAKCQYCIVTCYSDGSHTLNPMDHVQQFIPRCVWSLARAPTAKKQPKQNNCYVVEGRLGLYYYIAFVNNDSKVKYTANITLTQLNNLELAKPFKLPSQQQGTSLA